ncbi:NADH dehydrogenase subunit N [Syntrophus gentianae]|uniref:NADH-quinone oxidoreductase subunit N n=1 Tax=Syntrophus gentianae TaxID=43775 RepID=A0A1H7ZJN2_9BACT|nr:NADH-quinone oxidoreductase subunit N [Syntrophus gentianae]SEM58451.1 NADH dehydrogenase subunit N [Syntrophus gentianae]
MDINLPVINWVSIAPELVLFLTGLAVLLLGAFFPGLPGGAVAGISLAGVFLGLVTSVALWGRSELAFSNMLALDNYGLFFNMIFLIGTGLTILASISYLAKYKENSENIENGEYYAQLLFACVGMMFMAAGTDLMTLFLGLETLSIATYVLAGFIKKDLKGNEAAIKYMLLGAFSTGFLLYGIALIFGSTGSTNLAAIHQYLSGAAGAPPPMLLFGMALLIAGFGFKIAAVPFHMWTPDVYEGAPTIVTAFMSVGVKAAAFAAFLRVFLSALPSLQAEWTPILSMLAIATMTLGNLAALAQENIKRMLAYSSIAHAGYLIVGMVAARNVASDMGSSSILYYLLAYTFMNLGAFLVVLLYGRRAEDNLNIRDYAGMGYRYPILGATMVIFMLSLAGIPPTAGFMGKFYLFSSAVKGGFLGLAIIGLLNSVVSVYYYLRVTVMIYMKEPSTAMPRIEFVGTSLLATTLAATATLILGIFPERFISLARQSVSLLLG